MIPIWSPSVVEMLPHWFGNTIVIMMWTSLPTTIIITMFSLERQRGTSLQIPTAPPRRRPSSFDVIEAKVTIRITPIPKKKVTIPTFNTIEIWTITNGSWSIRFEPKQRTKVCRVQQPTPLENRCESERLPSIDALHLLLFLGERKSNPLSTKFKRN